MTCVSASDQMSCYTELPDKVTRTRMLTKYESYVQGKDYIFDIDMNIKTTQSLYLCSIKFTTD